MSSTIWKARPALRPKRSRRATSSAVGSGVDAAGDHADADEGAGFGAMNGFDQLRSGLEVFAFEVEDLAADHALDGADGVGDEGDDSDSGGGRAIEAGEDFEGAGLEGVAGEDGDGFAEGNVAGGLSAAKIVVIESRQIVVNERVGVEHFDGRAEALDTRRQGAGDGDAGLLARTGRSRLPPAKTEWRMAAWMEAGTVCAVGSSASSARSVRSAPS